jgi:hypothetical protein
MSKVKRVEMTFENRRILGDMSLRCAKYVAKLSLPNLGGSIRHSCINRETTTTSNQYIEVWRCEHGIITGGRAMNYYVQYETTEHIETDCEVLQPYPSQPAAELLDVLTCARRLHSNSSYQRNNALSCCTQYAEASTPFTSSYSLHQVPLPTNQPSGV